MDDFDRDEVVGDQRGRVCQDDGVDEDGVEQQWVCYVDGSVSVTGSFVPTIGESGTHSATVSVSIEVKLWKDVGSVLVIMTLCVRENSDVKRRLAEERCAPRTSSDL